MKGVIIFIMFGLSILTVIGDVFIKKATMASSRGVVFYLAVASAIYLSTVFGWFFVLKNIKLSIAGVFYTTSSLLFIVLFSVFYFREKLSPIEIIGVLMAFCSLFLLYRF